MTLIFIPRSGSSDAMIFIRPPDTRSDSLAGGDDEMLSEVISAPGYPADPRGIPTYNRDAFVKYLDLIFDAFWNILFKSTQ